MCFSQLMYETWGMIENIKNRVDYLLCCVIINFNDTDTYTYDTGTYYSKVHKEN